MHKRIIAFLFLFVLCGSHVAVAEQNEIALRESIQQGFADLFLQHRYDELNKIANDYRTTEARTPSGTWKLSRFYRGIARVPVDRNSNEQWQEALNVAKEWNNVKPSPASAITYGTLLVDYAWYFRGGGYAQTVTPDRWKAFFSILQKAHTHMNAAKSSASIDPEWYRLMVDIARGEQWPDKEADSLYNEALHKFPYYYETYFSIMESLQPKWSGSYEAMDSFAKAAVEYTKPREGTSLYVRLYWYISQCGCSKLSDIFETTQIDWNKTKTSMEDVLKHYPDQWNINNFAYLSCRAKDKDMTRSLMNRMTYVINGAWNNSEAYYNYCKAWATGG